MPDIIAIGGGQASFSFINKLRLLGYKKSVTLICGENFLPYQRPPLSKKFLIGDLEKERLFLKPQSFYDKNNIEVIKGQKVQKIDRKTNKVLLDNGQSLEYKKLFLGLGSKPKLLPQKLINGISDIHYIRNIGDVDLIINKFLSKRKILILGGGFIGLEVASVARKLGINVTLIESEERILKRSSSENVAKYIKDIHLSNGVIIKEKTTVKKFISNKQEFLGILTNNGEEIFADFLIAGVGIEPNTIIADNAGLNIDNGIVVNENCRTNDPKIYAAGDCVSFPFNKSLIRLESVGNAIEQSEIAAENVLGNMLEYQPIPWFWSDQYELKLQMVGFSADGNREVLRGDMASNQFAVFYLNDATVVAADAVNSPKEFMICKQLVGKEVDAAVLADPDADLKTLL